MAKFNKDMTINEILEQDPDKIDVLLATGMHCIGCWAATDETLEEACQVHGIDVEDVLIKKIKKKKRKIKKDLQELLASLFIYIYQPPFI